MESKEKKVIVCAAVKMYDGIVLTGYRHSDCIMLAAKLGYPTPITYDRQGFITSKNRFVNREQARKMCEKAGIKSKDPKGYGQMLYSEDLY